jgi:hypothetical protein
VTADNTREQLEQVGIIVPTIGGRPEYLPLALQSIRDAGNAYVILVGNKGFDASNFLESGLIDEYLDEQEPRLSASITFGINSLPSHIRFVSWLGDDDLLMPNSLTLVTKRILESDQPVMVFGGCLYIDPAGRPIWNQRSGQWAVPLLRFGPQLIPQPGSIFRRDVFESLGGLSREYGWAFDFNLFIGLSKHGRIAFLRETLACFRWHPGSLSVGLRRESVAEASAVRVSHLPTWLRGISPIWEWPVKQATYLAGVRLGKKLAR